MKKIILFGVLLILMTALVSCNKISFDDDGVLEFYQAEDGYVVSIKYKKYAKHVEEIEIPYLYNSKPVVGIGENAFSGCSNLKRITIPSSVETIGDYAFSGCRGLTSITIPDRVTSIGEEAFSDCDGLTSVTIPNSVTSIGESAFADCKGLTSITVPFVGATKDDTSNTHFGYVFGASSSLSNDIYVPSSLKSVVITGGTSIGSSAFSGCTSLTSVTIPSSVRRIGSSAFSNCDSLASIIVSDNNTSYKSIDGNLYSSDGKKLIQYAIGKNDTSFTIPDSVTSIDYAAFSGCTSLTSITIPDSVTSIGHWAFSDCDGLTSVTIPDSVRSIDFHAFYCCTSLTSVTIGNSVTSIGFSAFYECTSLTSVTIPDSVTSIGNGAFYRCTRLTSIIVSDNNTSYKSIDGNLYSRDGKTLIQYATGKNDTSFTIPGSVTSIDDSAFYKCWDLTSITIPDSVTSIGEEAFEYCRSLTSIIVSDNNTSYKSIDGNLYSKDGKTLIQYAIGKKDASFTIPSSVTSIGNCAFYGCTSLTSVTIGNSVTSIGEWAFYGCRILTSVTIGNSVTSIDNGAFLGCYKLVEVINKSSLHITAGSSTYENVAYYAKEVHTGDSKIVNKDGYLFYTYGGINYLIGYVCDDTDLILPENYNGESYEIYKYAFYDCDSLTSMTIGNSVTSIGDYAFSNCDSLTSIKYRGTEAEWVAISKGNEWDANTNGAYTITYNYDGE